jgi:RimJ/RimL family protein N-acetyltransferase
MSNSTQSNVIQTDRLVLAPHRVEDFSESAAMWAEPAIVRYIGGIPSTPGESRARLHRYAGHWALLGYGYWAVREKHSQRFVGEVGFADFKRGLGERFDQGPECGWALMPWAQGQHFATESIRAALEWAATRSMGQTVCMIHPDNKPSLCLAAKFGFHEYERTVFKEAPTILFARG